MADSFTYSFGGDSPDEAIAAWQEAEQNGEPIMQTLVERLADGAVDTEANDIIRWSDPDDEFGYRVGIRADGTRIYFVAGD